LLNRVCNFIAFDLLHRLEMRRLAAGLLGVMLLTATIGWTAIHPTHGRDWLTEQRLLPRAQFRDSLVTVENVRDFRWGPGAGLRSAWEPRTYDLSSVETVWYVLTPFSRDRRGPAHAFVSFGFADGRYLAISVEARREVGGVYRGPRPVEAVRDHVRRR
jgi:hypothetical protein